uniref:Protein-tyrosine-phosphatase n=1 Tax=Caenorhabditis tropicalis TaxID=1561998 RepID=A0A1I7UXK6_9PELO
MPADKDKETLNVNKIEGKIKRKDGKSQGNPKSKSMPVVFAGPNKTPTLLKKPTTPPPPLVMPPPVTHNTITATVLKETAAATLDLQTKELKQNRRKIKERAEKDPPKTTVRKKKNSATQSVSVDLRSSAENDGVAEKKKSQTSSEDSAKKRKSMESKSGGSKEPSDNDDKLPQKFNKELAQNFFKHMAESQRARRRTEDARLETMPESSQMNRSARSIKKTAKKTSKEPLEKIFRENGDPVWMVQERPETPDGEKNEDGGVAVSNPELALAMAEENVELDEKTCLDRLSDYISCTMPTGTQVPKDFQPDYSAPVEKLESNNEYFSHDAIVYNTVRNMVELSDGCLSLNCIHSYRIVFIAAMKRFEKKRDGMESKTSTETLTTSVTYPAKTASTELFQLKTCIVSNVSINLKTIVSVTYDVSGPSSLMILLRLFLAFTSIQAILAYRLNVPRVLLPYHPTVPVSFVLEVTHPTGGCFSWRSTRPDIVSVKSIDTNGAGCSDRAEIRSVAKPGSVGSSELSAVIFAEDKGSGTTLSCGVTVDEIATISIETTTKVLFVDAAPARMTVDAFNSDGDRFSTLSELALEWELASTSSNKAKPLRIVPFEQSTYEAPTEIVKLEKNRKKGYLILIEGVGTGTATLSAKFSDAYLQKVAAHNVELAVVANLLLVPSQDIYMPIHAVIPFQVLIVKQRGTEIVTMPNPSYELQIDGVDVASLDKKTSSVRALTTGNTAVHLLSSHVDVRAKAGLRPPSTAIHVVDAESIQWHVSGDNWMLETGKQYTINIELLDEHGNVMFVSDNSRFDTHIDEKVLRVDHKSDNGTWLLVTPLAPAKTTLRTKYVAIIDAKGNRIAQTGKVGGEQRATLVDPVRIVPPVIYLPFVAEKRSQIDLRATGGSGLFDWSTEDGHIATVELTSGRLTANSLGNTAVKATDKRNEQLGDRANVHILEVSGIGFGETVRETFVDDYLELNIKATGHTSDGVLVEMSDCRNIRVQVQISDNALLRHDSNVDSKLPKIGTGCGTISLKGLSSGDARVTITYLGHKASIDVAVYEKLKVSEDTSAIALGSSHPLTVSGGPRPWVLDPAHFYRRQEESSNTSLKVTFDNEKAVFKCGSTEVTEVVRVRVGNLKSNTLPHPIHAEVTVSICCAKPTRLEIFEASSRSAKCPLNVHSMLIESNAELILRGSGACNGVATPLDSINGLSPKWSSSDSSLLKINRQGIKSDVTTKKKEGVVTVQAQAGSLSAKYEVTVTHGLQVEPSRLVLWNEAVSKGTFTIVGGSGYFHIDNLPTAGSPISVALSSRSLTVTPKNNGQISLKVKDSCLIGQEAEAFVRIADIHSLAIDAPQYVEIGQEVEVEILAQDETGASFEKEHRPLAEAQLDANNQHVALRKIDGLRYRLRANSIGTVSLSATSKSSSGRILSSRPHTVQIFSPIFLQPKRLTLIPDAKFQLEVVGGPQPTPPLDFSLNNSMIASIEPNALITSSELGYTSITGTVRVGDGHVTKDSVVLRVVSLGGVTLSASSRKVETGGRVNLRLRGVIAGSEDEEPFAFGGAIYPFKVTWSVSDPSVLATTHPLGGDMVEPNSNQFAVWFDAIRGGSVTVKAVVELNEKARKHFIRRENTYIAETTVVVENAFALTQPSIAASTVRVAPNSQLRMSSSWSEAAFSVPSEYSSQVSITSDGLLRTFGKEGSSVFAVRKLNSPDNETVLFPITVSRVASFDVHPTTELRSAYENSPLLHFPVGAQVQLNVIPRDAKGRRLAAASNTVNFRPHRFDLTDIVATNNNQTLTITFKTAGDTVLRIGDAVNTHTSTFIRLSASESILPHTAQKFASDLVVSDVICLQTTILAEEGSHWTSQSSSLGRVNWLDQTYGVAQLSKAGNTFLKLHTSQQIIHSKISVLLPTALHFPEHHKLDFVTNDEQSVYIIPVTAGTNKTSRNKLSSLYGECTAEQIRSFDTISSPFDCHVSFIHDSKTLSAVNWLSAAAVFSPAFGYGCEVRRFDSTISTSAIVIPEELANAEIRAKISARWISDGSIQVADAYLDVPFHFAFVVEEKELVFSNMNQEESPLSIWVPSYDTKHIIVSACEGDIVTVTKKSKPSEKHSEKATLFYNVHLNIKSAALFTEHAKKCQVTVENTFTGQIVRVPVTVQLLDETAKQVFNALESRGVIDVLLILAQKHSHVIPTLLWTCLIGIIILVVGIYVKTNIFDKTGSFGDNSMSETHQTSMASSMNSTNVSLREPVFRSTPIAGSPQVALPTARERLRNTMGSGGDNRLWSY